MARKERTCVVLGGGGSRGLSHLGVLQVLEREGIPLHSIVGTSVGAIVGSVLISGILFFPASVTRVYETREVLIPRGASVETIAGILKADGQQRNVGPFVQISRLGNPLVNEVLIPLGEKDYWNRQDPRDDSQFIGHYLNPELAALIHVLYPGLPAPPATGRSDLVSVLLTGVPTLNFTGPQPSDELRLNTAIPPAANPDRLGVLNGDFAGFPNGRRLGDDVVDIELRAIACGYGPILHQALGLCDLQPNDIIGDGVDANDRSFLSTFPYVAPPRQGYDSHT